MREGILCIDIIANSIYNILTEILLILFSERSVNMRKCDKCQIIIKDNEQRCPICGKEIEGFNQSATQQSTEVASPLYETRGLDFGGWVKNILQQTAFSAAVVIYVINIVLNIIIGIADGITWSYLASVASMLLLAVPLVMMYKDRNNRESSVKTLSAMRFIKILAGVQIVLVGLMIAVLLAGSVIMALAGNTAVMELFGMDAFVSMEGIVLSDQEKIMLMSAALFVGTIFAAVVSIPYAVATFLLTSDITSALKGKTLKKLRGTGVFRAYNIITLGFSILAAIGILGMYQGNALMGVFAAAGMLTAAIPGFLLSRLATQLNNIVKTEFWLSSVKNN